MEAKSSSCGGGLALSPDGQQLAFMVSCDNEWSLQIAPSSGGDTREIARLQKDEAAWGRGLVWTPDGRHLLFYGNRDKATGLCELWRIPVEGGEPQNLGLTMKVYQPLSFHPDGHRIAFTGPGPTPGGEVWAMENFLPGFAAAE
jgi:Tol biopolymer transport system component